MKKLNPMKISVRRLILNKVKKLFYNAEGVKKDDGCGFNKTAK